MRSTARFDGRCVKLALVAMVAIFVMVFVASASAQSGVSTGSIVGTVTDPSGAVVSGAKVSVTNSGTNQTSVANTTSSGLYNSGAVVPGQYKIRVEAKGFRTTEMSVTVEVGSITAGNIHLELGLVALRLWNWLMNLQRRRVGSNLLKTAGCS